MSLAEIHRLQIDQALDFLLVEQSFAQIEITKKLKILGFKVSRPSLSNLYKKKSTGSKLLKTAAIGLTMLLKRDHCLEWKESNFVKIKDCLPNPVLPDAETTSPTAQNLPNDAIIHDGRLYVSEKIAFYQKAKMEIIEIGLRLNHFASYFEGTKDSAFKDPLDQLLERGVNVKCYILDPSEGGFATKYFEDRARLQPNEKTKLDHLSDSLASLRNRFIRINKCGYQGKIELYTYSHFPYFHAVAIDLNNERGALCISPYLYGVARSNTPVIEVSQQSNKTLYKKYARSISAIIKGASKLI